MPFFEPELSPASEVPEETERVWIPPRWDRPSEGVLPSVIGVSKLFGRTDTVALALDHLRVYPNGFQLALLALTSPRLPLGLQFGGFATFSLISASTAAPDAPNRPTPPPVRRPPFRPGLMEMAPRIGIRFSNGQSAGTGSRSLADLPKDDEGIPTEPVILGGGMNGGGGRYRFEQWVFPLPTPGPLEVFAEWSYAGLEEISIVVDGDEVRAAAEHATVLWA